MNQLRFISLHEALKLHAKSLMMFAGIPGVRDVKLLESALFQPQMMLFGEYVYKDVHEMGAAYCFHIIKNHPFLDGNKRAGLLIALAFLRKNGIKIKADHDELYLLAMHTASSQIDKDAIAHFFRETAILQKN